MFIVAIHGILIKFLVLIDSTNFILISTVLNSIISSLYISKNTKDQCDPCPL
jgi:hypothetical protein